MSIIRVRISWPSSRISFRTTERRIRLRRRGSAHRGLSDKAEVAMLIAMAL